ncbi:MAG: prephenate dehydrogenase/arogenate dehydrogenase family protein [Acidimicrobiia bacterium]|nr:prephenate dehydrogenase/arogenate dehydrogenase family protein [Acidimicrobiia bacterium]
MQRALISGTGLIGTSIALGLQDLGWETLGWDPNPDALDGAARTGAVVPIGGLDSVLLGTNDLLVLAAPPSAVRSTLSELETAALVIDVASVKAPIIEVVRTERFVGTHPMAGREVTGPDAARPGLFRGATWVVVPDGADESDVLTVESIVVGLGARPIRMGAAEHDAAVARISHLPQIVAAALLDGAGEVPGAMELAAGSFRDLTRVAASDPAIWMDILTVNRREVMNAVEALRVRLAALATSDADLRVMLAQARRLRASLGPELAVVRVALEDRPGEMASVGHALAECGADLRDLQLRHAPYGGGGILTLSVRAGEENVLRAALAAEGLSAVVPLVESD